MIPPFEDHLAPYAIRSAGADERKDAEPEHPWRSPFDLDRHRIIECTAFRRLEHKTQVFAPAFHDHFRTRLMHTLEAAHIAKRLALGLLANELLAEAITLAHDLGHPPFGHAGETALARAMARHGGFNHNTHALRVVDYLEHPYPAFRGLNLTAETRAGLIAHDTRYDEPAPIDHPHAPGGPSVEAQISSLADRIAYNCHDLEDAIGAELVTLRDLKDVELWQMAYEDVAARHEVSHVFAVRRAVLDGLLHDVLRNAIDASRAALAKMTSPDQVKSAPSPLVTLSADTDARLVQLESFLSKRVYRHDEVVKMDTAGRRMVRALFDAYHDHPEELPPRFATRIEEQGVPRVVCDYLAGMTDRFCKAEHDRLVGRP